MARVGSATPSSTPRRFTPASPTPRSHRDQPARPARAANRREAENRSLTRRPCAAQGWRSQTSSIPTGLLGARPMAGHVSLGQLKLMTAIEQCRSAALGGHVERCEDCGHSRIAYNSCRNRHCPKCQGAATP